MMFVLAMEFSKELRRPSAALHLTTDFGGHGGGVTPVPIPNTEVKPSSADGTWVERPWESRTPPSSHVRRTPSDGGPSSFSAVDWPVPCRSRPPPRPAAAGPPDPQREEANPAGRLGRARARARRGSGARRDADKLKKAGWGGVARKGAGRMRDDGPRRRLQGLPGGHAGRAGAVGARGVDRRGRGPGRGPGRGGPGSRRHRRRRPVPTTSTPPIPASVAPSRPAASSGPSSGSARPARRSSGSASRRPARSCGRSPTRRPLPSPSASCSGSPTTGSAGGRSAAIELEAFRDLSGSTEQHPVLRRLLPGAGPPREGRRAVGGAAGRVAQRRRSWPRAASSRAGSLADQGTPRATPSDSVSDRQECPTSAAKVKQAGWGGVARKGAGRMRDAGPGDASKAFRAATPEGREPWEPEVWIDEGVVRGEADKAVGRGRSAAGPPAPPTRATSRPTRRCAGPWPPSAADRLDARLKDAGKAFRRERFEEARSILRPLAEQAPTAESVRELLGLTYYRLGRWKLAVTELEAFRTLSGSTEQHPVLADCYRALGRHAKVAELWEELRAASPERRARGRGPHRLRRLAGRPGPARRRHRACSSASKPPDQAAPGAPPARHLRAGRPATSGPATCPKARQLFAQRGRAPTRELGDVERPRSARCGEPAAGRQRCHTPGRRVGVLPPPRPLTAPSEAPMSTHHRSRPGDQPRRPRRHPQPRRRSSARCPRATRCSPSSSPSAPRTARPSPSRSPGSAPPAAAAAGTPARSCSSSAASGGGSSGPGAPPRAAPRWSPPWPSPRGGRRRPARRWRPRWHAVAGRL